MLLANAKMLWRKVAGKSLDRTRNDPCNYWLKSAQWFNLPGVAGYHIYLDTFSVFYYSLYSLMLLSCK